MNKIYTQLQKIKEEQRIGIMTHIVLGYPTLKDSIELAKAMIGAGVDFIELQIPFTDPLADGSTIMKANRSALKEGIKVNDAFIAMQELSQELSIPLLFMTYYQIVFRRGVKKFCEDAARAGASGLIVPDVPIDEEQYDHYWKCAEDKGLIAMRFLSTVSTKERMEKVLDKDGRFLYFIGQKGTTGARTSLNEELGFHLQRIRAQRQASIAVGFGISKPEHIRTLKGVGADVAVIGSALLNVYNDAPEGENIEKVKEYVRGMVDAGR